MRVVNANTIRPDEIQPSDVMLLTIKAMVTWNGHYRLYQCPYPYVSHGDEVPQGSRIHNEREVCEALFPSLARVATPDV